VMGRIVDSILPRGLLGAVLKDLGKEIYMKIPHKVTN
jgi:hypothetical protein